MKEGIIEESTSLWSSPVVPVLKPSGDISLCDDFRKLNNINVQEHCYIPDLASKFSHMWFVMEKMPVAFYSHQLCRGYMDVPVV